MEIGYSEWFTFLWTRLFQIILLLHTAATSYSQWDVQCLTQDVDESGVCFYYMHMMGCAWKTKHSHVLTTFLDHLLENISMVWCANPSDHLTDKISSILPSLITWLVGLVINCWWEPVAPGFFVATHFIQRYVQNKHSMREVCKT